MKKLVRNADVLNIDANIYFVPIETDNSIAATTIKPVVIDFENEILDPSALSDFNMFVQNAYATIEYYDFEIYKNEHHKSKSFPYTSRYVWIAHRTEIDADSVPKYIHLRISEHAQEFSKESIKRLSKQYKEEAEAIKLPKTKKKQRYVLDEFIVDGSKYKTYEEALHAIELKIYNWLKERNVDVAQYEPLGW